MEGEGVGGSSKGRWRGDVRGYVERERDEVTVKEVMFTFTCVQEK